MTFERKRLKGLGFTLKGPEEHEGKSRCSWITRGVGFFPTIMSVRIEKMNGRRPENDQVSPVVDFFFSEKGELVIQQKQGLNPYLNRVLLSPPQFIIPEHELRFKSYEISTKTGLYGDFVILTAEEKKQIHCIILNISAIGILDGVDEIEINGTFRMFEKAIGRLRPVKGIVLPFFTTIEVSHGEQFDMIKEFTPASYAAVLKLVGQIDFMEFPLVGRFLSIAMSVNNDRGGGKSPKQGQEEARKSFGEVFTA